MEKGRMGILAQIHSEFDQVAKYCLTLVRSTTNPVKIDSKDLRGIHRLDYMSLPTIGKLLQKWEVQAHYDLFGSNCQTLVGDVRNRIIKASNGLELHLPGTNERARIDDERKLIPYFKNRFPGWTSKKLVRVPEVQIQYAIGIQHGGERVEVFAASDATQET